MDQWTEGRTNGRTDGWTDQRTDTPSYTDATAHLKKAEEGNGTGNDLRGNAMANGECFHCGHRGHRAFECPNNDQYTRSVESFNHALEEHIAQQDETVCEAKVLGFCCAVAECSLGVY